MWILFLILGLILLILLFKLFRVPKNPCITFISGEVKGGKTMLGVWLAIRKYKRVLFIWKIKCFFCKLFHKDLPEEPVFCSNIPVAGVPFVKLTKKIIEREERLPYKSVTFISESYLLIDSMTIKNPVLNEKAQLFYKLYGHTTRGGFCFVESQTISDNHNSLRRSIARYYQIFENKKFKPFFALLKIHELAYSEDNSVVNVNNMDFQDKSCWIFVPWRVVKFYDCYTFSAFTDDLPVNSDQRFIPVGNKYRHLLKTREGELVSFRTFHTLEKYKGDYEHDE